MYKVFEDPITRQLLAEVVYENWYEAYIEYENDKDKMDLEKRIKKEISEFLKECHVNVIHLPEGIIFEVDC